MLVTIVIPAYNAKEFISATIESVRAQTHKQWELIVVDGGSSDGTFELAEEYGERDPRIMAERLRRAGTAVSACNLGFAQRSWKSEYTLFLDHDDLLVNDGLAKLVNALKADPDAVAAYGRFRGIDENGHPMRGPEADRFTESRMIVDRNRLVPLPVDAPLTFSALAYGNCIMATGQVLIRTEAVRRAGPFDSATFPCDDWDMWLRLSLVGSILPVDGVVLEYRLNDDKRLPADEEMDEGDLQVRRKLAASLAGHELGDIALTAWRLRERHQISQAARRAVAHATRSRVGDAKSEAEHAAQLWAEYRQHWGIWRRSGKPPAQATPPKPPKTPVIQTVESPGITPNLHSAART